MKISLDVLKKYYSIVHGKVYAGYEFAKDKSFHKAIVFAIHEDKVFSYCITSQEGTINYFKTIDNQAIVELTKQDVKTFFNDDKKSWIYCGKANLSEFSLDEFLSKLQDETIKYVSDASKLLTNQITKATTQSIFYSQADLQEFGISTN